VRKHFPDVSGPDSDSDADANPDADAHADAVAWSNVSVVQH
jgi:hypothetical protein